MDRFWQGRGVLIMAGMPFDPPKTGYGRTYPIEIVPYDDAWPEQFTIEAERIRTALGDVAVRVDHIGSTAVPAMAAKAVIDIQVSVPSLGPVDAYRIPLERLGYGYRHDPDNADHEYFFRDVDGVRTFQIHVCPAGSGWERSHLAFRDHLRGNPKAAAEYVTLKRDLAARFPMSMDDYLDRKEGWIQPLVDDLMRRQDA
jgi:GrpB-like predicted nucleotidyltransferase (UPF0157 family)